MSYEISKLQVRFVLNSVRAERRSFCREQYRIPIRFERHWIQDCRT